LKEIIPLHTDVDVLRARTRGRELASRLGFSSIDLTLIATAISEVARNIITYAGSGRILLNPLGEKGLEIVAEDQGPGILDLEMALRDGYSTSRSFGMGLPGSRRIMDEFEIDSGPGKGTTVVMRKWRERLPS
jgi:serine/threonine-protein kinase RsbT